MILIIISFPEIGHSNNIINNIMILSVRSAAVEVFFPPAFVLGNSNRNIDNNIVSRNKS